MPTWCFRDFREALDLTRLSFTGTTSDGIRVMWKDNFESFYTEVAELGR